MRAKHGIGLPELVGVLHAEGESAPVLADILFEQFVFADEPAEGGECDLIGP